MSQKNSHCSYCGVRFAPEAPFPRKCGGCSRTTWVNPLPVAVLLLPIDGGSEQGLLAIRRGIEPRRGQLALPGGFIDLNETWQEAAARELFEETGIHIDPAGVTEFRVRSARDGTLLIFALAPPMRASDLPPFEPTNETSERVVLREPIDLAFGLHTEAARAWFDSRGSARSP